MPITLAFFVVFLGLVEIATRAGFQRIGRIESRVNQEYHQALALRPATAGVPPKILLVGNSLLLEGMDDSIHQLVAPDARVYRFVVEQTHYFDWYYGVQRLLAEGSRPDYLVFCIGPTHWVSGGIRGDYSSFYLYQTSEIPAVAHDVGYGFTQEAGLFAARYSLYFAGRSNLRNFILNRLYPSYGEVLHDLTTVPAPAFPADRVASTTDRRLRALAAVIENRTRLAILLPPSFAPLVYESSLSAAAETIGVPFLSPFHPGELPEEAFKDHMHLSQAGAHKFTVALARQLREMVATTGSRPPTMN